MASRANEHAWLSSQPLRLCYSIYGWASILARLPLWVLRSSIPALRPLPSWTFRQSIMRHVLYSIVALHSKTGVAETLTLDPKHEGDRFVVMQPAPADAYTGPLASRDGIEPQPVGATWYPARGPATPAEAQRLRTVVLWLHGGAFVMGDGRTAATGFAAGVLVAQAGVDAVLAPQYRLAHYGRGGAPFPAALQDALTAYLYLVRGLRVPPRRVVLAGDSAGGNLAIALLRFLELAGPAPAIEKPSCAVLVAPWVAPLSGDGDASAKRHTDYLPPSFLLWGARAYAAGADKAQDDDDGAAAWINPKGHAFATSVPVYVSVGTAELIGPDAVAWAGEMRGVRGNDVELDFEEGAPHDTIMAGHLLGWTASAEGVGRRIGAFLRRKQQQQQQQQQ